jgi:type I restriction enzyme S subunit
MLEKARTTSGLYSLSVGKVGELEVPLPSVSEQRALADALEVRASIVASARRAAEGEVAAIKALPASLLRRVFSAEL